MKEISPVDLMGGDLVWGETVRSPSLELRRSWVLVSSSSSLLAGCGVR